jgi:hypothetical protein
MQLAGIVLPRPSPRSSSDKQFWTDGQLEPIEDRSIMKTLSVEQQIANLRPAVRSGFAPYFHYGLLAGATGLVILSILVASRSADDCDLSRNRGDF